VTRVKVRVEEKKHKKNIKKTSSAASTTTPKRDLYQNTPWFIDAVKKISRRSFGPNLF
jgi:hypothetical protein